MRIKQERRLEAVKAILNGELLLEEAMVKYRIKDKRTISSWIKKYSPMIAAPNAASSEASIAHTAAENLFDEATLLRKIVALQDKVRQLENLNAHLLQQWGQLLEKIDITELQID